MMASTTAAQMAPHRQARRQEPVAVVMPAMNGKALYKEAVKLQPGLRVLYMSGYTENVIASRGVLEEGVNFIQKPFAPKALVAKVRQVLNQNEAYFAPVDRGVWALAA